MKTNSSNPKPSPEHHKPTTFCDLKEVLAPIEWMWEGWLPRGFVTILAGESGQGKSALALRLAGCITNSWKWPDGAPAPEQPGLVAWCEAEASQALNLERAIRWGIDLSRMRTPLADLLADVSLTNPGHFEAINELAHKVQVRLIIIDSLSGANHRNENSSREMLPIVQALAKLARDTNKPLLLTHHLRKKGQSDLNTVELDRLRGSSAIVQSARIVMAADRPNPESDWRRLRVIKSNLAKAPELLGYLLATDRPEFGESPAADSHRATALQEAKVFLRGRLASGPVESTIVQDEARRAGISERTLDTAKQTLQVKSTREGGTNGRWVWSL